MTAKNRYIYWILSAVIASLTIFSIFQYTNVKALETNVENNYNRAFNELVNYVDDIDTLLQKSMLVSSASQLSTISSELFRQTTAAKACLGQLPISEVQLENTEKFLSQIGDFTYMLSQNVINNKTISDEEYNTLSELSTYATNLNNSLIAMQQDIYDGKISFGTVSRNANKYLDNAVSAAGGDILSDFESVEKEFQEYPSLIYDGPFSEHIQNIKPVMLENQETITSDAGLAKAKEFLGSAGQNLSYTGETQNTAINTYSYTASYDDRDVYISMTKQGGFPLYFLDTRTVNSENITFEDAVSAAKDFLYSRGYSSLKESYYDKSDCVATINFAYEQGDVICYSDLIKVKVALDNGEILGFEANGYIMNHKHRDFAERTLTLMEAQERVNPHLSIDSTAVALIPKDNKQEVLCYEFKGNHNGRNFLIYINVQTGAEEQILMLIESEDGILTV